MPKKCIYCESIDILPMKNGKMFCLTCQKSYIEYKEPVESFNPNHEGYSFQILIK